MNFLNRFASDVVTPIAVTINRILSIEVEALKSLAKIVSYSDVKA